MRRGCFITLEGGEGVGKSTNINFLKTLLESYGLDVITTREPGGTPFAEKIRQVLLEETEEQISSMTELLLMFAARAQHIEQLILPAISKGQWVICDRFTDATYAYQGAGRSEKLTPMINWLEHHAQSGLSPDLTLLLDAPVSVGMARAKQRGVLDRFEREQVDFFERVRHSYLLRVEQNQERMKIIQADAPLVRVQNQIKQVVEQTFFNHE